MMIVHIVEHFTGIDNGTGSWYLFWSGFGSDISEFAILGYLINWYKKHREHMALHKKHMELMNASLDQSRQQKTSVWHVQDTAE